MSWIRTRSKPQATFSRKSQPYYEWLTDSSPLPWDRSLAGLKFLALESRVFLKRTHEKLDQLYEGLAWSALQQAVLNRGKERADRRKIEFNRGKIAKQRGGSVAHGKSSWVRASPRQVSLIKIKCLYTPNDLLILEIQPAITELVSPQSIALRVRDFIEEAILLLLSATTHNSFWQLVPLHIHGPLFEIEPLSLQSTIQALLSSRIKLLNSRSPSSIILLRHLRLEPPQAQPCIVLATDSLTDSIRRDSLKVGTGEEWIFLPRETLL